MAFQKTGRATQVGKSMSFDEVQRQKNKVNDLRQQSEDTPKCAHSTDPDDDAETNGNASQSRFSK